MKVFQHEHQPVVDFQASDGVGDVFAELLVLEALLGSNFVYAGDAAFVVVGALVALAEIDRLVDRDPVDQLKNRCAGLYESSFSYALTKTV